LRIWWLNEDHVVPRPAEWLTNPYKCRSARREPHVEGYVSSIVIEKPFDVVWSAISNPNSYARLYPNWVKSVNEKDKNTFHVSDQFGGTYDVKLVANQEFGIVDLIIGQETSRSRIYPIDDKRTAITHLATRWKGASPLIWFFHKRTTDRDFKNAKTVIEGQQ